MQALQGQVVTKHMFRQFWAEEMAPYDRIERFFRVVKARDADYIVRKDFMPLLEELLTYHPGLEFLEATPEFQEK